jgi:hypothetical protein
LIAHGLPPQITGYDGMNRNFNVPLLNIKCNSTNETLLNSKIGLVRTKILAKLPLISGITGQWGSYGHFLLVSTMPPQSAPSGGNI